jgi:hypothetical protein
MKDIIDRLSSPGIADYELDCGVCEAAIDEIKRLRINHRRYETVRRMTAQQFAAACEINIRMGKPFDQIIDELRPFALPSGGPDQTHN